MRSHSVYGKETLDDTVEEWRLSIDPQVADLGSNASAAE